MSANNIPASKFSCQYEFAHVWSALPFMNFAHYFVCPEGINTSQELSII